MAQYKKLRFSTQSPAPGIFRRTYAGITRRQRNLPENQARVAALRTLLVGTTIITGLFFGLLLLSYFAAGNTHIGVRLLVNGLAFVYLVITYQFFRRNWQHAAALLLVIYYILIAALAAWQWGINMPFAVLIMSFTITLAAILLGARSAPYTALALSAVILGVQLATTTKFHVPNTSWETGEPSKFGEAIAYCLLFAVLALITWLFGREIERSLIQARQAEEALIAEKKLLSVRLKERTDKLKTAQLKEMQQIYRFAELGQLSTALLHELANHLTSLTLDIEDLKDKQRGESIARAKQSIAHLDDLVARVSTQLKDEGEVRAFNALYNLQTVAAYIRPRFVEADVQLTLTHTGSKQNLQFYGDATRFSQVMTILITNALDATAPSTVAQRNRRVRVQLFARAQELEIRVSDWGEGIPEAEKSRLFKPFYSTKQDGMGIGLFITKQIIGSHFKGSIELTKFRNPTMFTVILPKRNHDGRA